MNVIFVLIAVSLMVAIGFLVTFIWSIRAGQYEDDYTPSVRILFDDDINILPGDSTEATKAEAKPESESQSENKPKT